MNATTIAKAIKSHGDASLKHAKYEAYGVVSGMAIGLAVDEFRGDVRRALRWLNGKCGLEVSADYYKSTLQQCGIEPNKETK
jgi:hypothetical protein